MADAFVTDLASGLLFKLVSLAAEEVIQAWNLQENLVTLRERLETIDALLSDADSKRLEMSAVQSWFNKLEDVARVADAFMDELAYEVTRRKVEHRGMLRHFFSTKKSILYRSKVAHRIKSIHTSFDNIFRLARDLGLQPVAHLTTTVQPREIRNTPPSEDESLIVGRDDAISFLVETVCTNHDEDLPVIAVMGMGGQGKTTLARMVYNRDVVTDTFKKRMWVTVSDDFNFMKILNQMVASLTSTAYSVLENTEGLIKKLQSSLRGAKFLLVLDDVWNERPEEWDKLRNSLLGVGGASGSMILVTTRKQKVVDVMRCFITHRVEKLSQEDSWELFKRRAFSRGGVLETARFVAMGRRMVERCGGLPLAIKALGGLLHSKKSEQEWLRIQDSATWDSNDDVLPSLRLSYDNLPHSSLKKCFAYCSILPKDSIISKDEMVRIWMALGFLLLPKGSSMLMEDIGSEYFNILVWNCLLQDGGRDWYGKIYYKMHDLVHDLALDLSKHYSVTVKADCHELNHISKAIYVRVDEGNSHIKPPILKRNFEKVQVLYAEPHIVSDLVPCPSHLIGLVLIKSNKDGLPSSLRNLKYLKYLDISRCSSTYKLPDYITRLYNLQTLSVGWATQLPRKICNLINLRHILVAHAGGLVSSDMFSKVERLTCLQTLPQFVVSRDHQCLIGQLEKLKNLQGTLNLYGLGDVENMEEASKASLHTKSNIEHLKLVWRKNEDVMEEKENNHEDVMEGLQPHANLKELAVENFMGKKFASWITFMTNLEKITFRNCKRCEEFPQLGHLPKLRTIEIVGMDNVKVISSHLCGGQGSISGELNENGAEETVATMYLSLKELHLWNMPKLEEWIDPAMDTSGQDPPNVLVFPELEELRVMYCSKLTRIPSSCYPLMKKLYITDLDSSKLLESISEKACGLTDLELKNINGGVRQSSSSSSSSSSSMNVIMGELLKKNSVSLKTLSVRKLQGLAYLTLGTGLKTLELIDLPELNTINVIKGSDALKHLSIWSCLNYAVFVQSVSSTVESLELGPFSKDLDEFPWPLSFSFPNVVKLRVIGWKKLKWIVDERQPDDYLTSIFPALRHLQIRSFQGVKSLPISLAKLPFLESLSISFCGNLESLPKFHDNLQFLGIGGCPIIEERYRKGSGPEWSKIQHIKQIHGLD